LISILACKSRNSTARHKKTYVPREGTKCDHSTAQKYFYRLVPLDGTKCATALHKMCHSTAQNVPQHGTKCATARQQKTFRLMCHGNAQNVSYHSTKRLLGKFCFFHIRKQVCSLNRSAGLEIL
jgi:hypothetical protein